MILLEQISSSQSTSHHRQSANQLPDYQIIQLPDPEKPVSNERNGGPMIVHALVAVMFVGGMQNQPPKPIPNPRLRM